jgi:hypothetical protein
MALIDELMPLTTLVIFMGGNSGQMIVDLLQHHSSFAKYDDTKLANNGSFIRPIFLPYHDRQYATRLPNSDKIGGVVGRLSWLRDEDTRLWLRQQTEDWIVRAFKKFSSVDLDTVIKKQLRLAIPSHLNPKFADWVLPESKKIFVIDHNSYFAVRADSAKNEHKHPKDPMDLVQFCAQRVAINRTWNQQTRFSYQNSLIMHRSNLITENKQLHEDTLCDIMQLHGLTVSDEQKNKIWDSVLRYISVQKDLGYIA